MSLPYGKKASAEEIICPESRHLFGLEPGGESRAPDSQSAVLSSFGQDVHAHPRTLGHPPTAGSSHPDLAEASEGCLDSQSSAVNTAEGFSYLRVTSHSPSCQQPKHPSTCRLQISAKVSSKSVSLESGVQSGITPNLGNCREDFGAEPSQEPPCLKGC